MKHPDLIIFAGTVAFLIATAIYMVKTGPAAPPRMERASAGVATFDHFCRGAALVPRAIADCEREMAAAKTDADRLQVERTFSAVKLRAPRPSTPTR